MNTIVCIVHVSPMYIPDVHMYILKIINPIIHVHVRVVGSATLTVCSGFLGRGLLLAHLYLCDPESKAVVSQILSFAFIVPFQLAMR